MGAEKKTSRPPRVGLLDRLSLAVTGRANDRVRAASAADAYAANTNLRARNEYLRVTGEALAAQVTYLEALLENARCDLLELADDHRDVVAELRELHPEQTGIPARLRHDYLVESTVSALLTRGLDTTIPVWEARGGAALRIVEQLLRAADAEDALTPELSELARLLGADLQEQVRPVVEGTR